MPPRASPARSSSFRLSDVRELLSARAGAIAAATSDASKKFSPTLREVSAGDDARADARATPPSVSMWLNSRASDASAALERT
jgi:hypothetical protein